LKDNKFVHASTSKGVIVSDLSETYYKKYFHSAGRLRQSISWKD
jgi:lipoprotein Spr